jgi:hypothetical protein
MLSNFYGAGMQRWTCGGPSRGVSELQMSLQGHENKRLGYRSPRGRPEERSFDESTPREGSASNGRSAEAAVEAWTGTAPTHGKNTQVDQQPRRSTLAAHVAGRNRATAPCCTGEGCGGIVVGVCSPHKRSSAPGRGQTAQKRAQMQKKASCRLWTTPRGARSKGEHLRTPAIILHHLLWL